MENHIENNMVKEADWLFKFLTQKKYHLFRLFIALLVPLGLLWNKQWGEYSGWYDNLDWVLSYIILLIIFCINIYLLMPRYLYQGKTALYLLSLFSTILIISLLSFALRQAILEDHRLISKPGDIDNWVSVLAVSVFLTPFYLVSTAFRLFQKWVAAAKRIDELQNHALHSELKALRNQIQPHFLFNMLNNIVVINKTDPIMASDIIMRLSNFLRYLIYESSNSKVYISQEIQFIKDFLELEQLRRDNFTYTVEFDPLNVMMSKIPSHILLTLVENATKHSVNPIDDSYIKVSLHIAFDQIFIHCENSVPPEAQIREVGGLGLDNLVKRLELLYPGKFEYLADKSDSCYKVNLRFPL